MSPNRGLFSSIPVALCLYAPTRTTRCGLRSYGQSRLIGEEAGGLLVRVDRSGEKGISHSTLDMVSFFDRVQGGPSSDVRPVD